MTAEALVLRRRDEALRWLLGGLALARLGGRGGADVLSGAAWLVRAVDELAALPPPGVIADLGHLLTSSSRWRSPVDEAPYFGDERLQKALGAYQDHVLDRLLADPRLDEAADAVARLPVAARPAAVARLAAALIERTGLRGTVVSPAVARGLTARRGDELVSAGRTALHEDGALSSRLAAGYEALVRAAQGTRQLLGEREVFVLEHLEVLGSAARRVAVEQIVEAAEVLGQGLPRRFRRISARRGQAPTALVDDSLYPTGGFSSVVNTGSLENLVTSELVYMEDGADIDLFDLRYVEGELLYYMRDESAFVRRRHEIVFVFAPALAALRTKDEGLPWQRGVLALGLVLLVIRRLVEALGHEALAIEVLFARGDQGEPVLREEQELMALLLSDERERGLAQVGETPGVAEVLEAMSPRGQRARRALTDVVVFGAASDLRAPAGVAAMAIDEAAPVLSWSGADRHAVVTERDVEDDALAAWQGAALELLQSMV
ncbi:MAG TPA: hypothetical protein VIF57_12465 [Polyangia bacterium]|jgi:hypothetical protein